MKIFWSVLIVVGVLAAAAGAVYLWFRVRKKNELTEDDCCSWDEVPECEECCEDEAAE